MKNLFKNIEIWLSLVGLLVIVLVPSLFSTQANNAWWQTAAITAIAVGLLHGMLFWTVRERQRQVRQVAIRDIQAMLRDRINNQLALIMFNYDSSQTLDAEQHERIVDVQQAVQTISQQLNAVSDESLRHWKDRYPYIDERLVASMPQPKR